MDDTTAKIETIVIPGEWPMKLLFELLMGTNPPGLDSGGKRLLPPPITVLLPIIVRPSRVWNVLYGLLLVATMGAPFVVSVVFILLQILTPHIIFLGGGNLVAKGHFSCSLDGAGFALRWRRFGRCVCLWVDMLPGCREERPGSRNHG